MKQFRTKELFADLYENQNKPLVVIIGGSRAGIWSVSPLLLDYLKEHYNVLIFAYFGVGGLPKNLIKVPLEYFINGINKVKTILNLKDKDIIIIGNSKGGEAALLLISKYINAGAAIACVPSCYVWQGIRKNLLDMIIPKSSWTYNNKQLPFIKLKFDREILKDIKKKSYNSCYSKSIKTNMNSSAKIDLSNYKGQLLLLSAEADNYWPSKEMSENIMRDFNINVTHTVLNLSGHYFQEYEESIVETIKFLEKTRKIE
jgi:esterase/lipase